MVIDDGKFIAKLLRVWPRELWEDQRIVLAVSGGADSVALLRAMHSLVDDTCQLRVAHFNHGWRGAESDQDQLFVEQLSNQFSLHCTIGRIEQQQDTSRSEQTARKLRYAFLQATAEQFQAQFIVTAHTASDRVETMLHNLCRGTGLSGVCSLRSSRKLTQSMTLVRPLLSHFREEVIAYLNLIDQSFRNDSSNINEHYRRNFLRHSVLPLLRQSYGDSLDQRLLSFSQLAEESIGQQHENTKRYLGQRDELIRQEVMLGTLAKPLQSEITIPCQMKLPTAWPTVLQVVQHLWGEQSWTRQAMSRSHWDRLRNAWHQIGPPKQAKRTLRLRSLFQLPGAIQVFECNGWLIIRPSTASEPLPSDLPQ